MKKMLFYMTMFAVVLNITACGSNQQQGTQTTTVSNISTPARTAPVKTASVTDTHWTLVELNGNPVEASSGVFIFMNSSDGRVHGNLSCNSFSGSFTLQEGNRISFSQLVNTQMLCIAGMEIEAEMSRILQLADNYNLTETQFVLNRARMAPLARFEVVSED
ncbi:MAG: META domain-containing protein [Bacteroidales bacterium]|nr:META domain-containing protein [Bacteroidales bacterium]